MNVALLPVAAPVIVSPLVYFLADKWRRFVMLFYIFGLLAVAVYILFRADAGSAALFTSTFGEGEGMAPLYFSIHPYGRIAAFGFTLVGALALLYGLDVSKAAEQAVSLAAIGSAVGIAFSGNFLTLFIFWEFLTVTTAGLIMLNGTPTSVNMGYRFLLFQLAGGLCLFLGIMQHYTATGSFLLATPEAGLPFFILGIGIKAVFLPLHIWLPWGYPSASLASSVVLAGLTTKVGVFAVARILPSHEGIVLMGACMAIFGATCALLQSELRRLLSYHIISQVGFMVAGVGLGIPVSVDGGLLHLVNHMLYKALLFMSAGAVIYATGKEDIHDLQPHGKTEGEVNVPPVWLILPVAVLGAVIGALAIAGTPPFNGYVSKYLLKKAMHGVEPMEQMLIIAGVGTSLSFCKFVYFGFIKARARAYRELTASMRAAILSVSALCLLFGICPTVLEPILPHGSHLTVYSLSGAWAALEIILTGVVVFILIARILERGIHAPYWLSVEYLLYRPLITLGGTAYTFSGKVLETVVDGLFVQTPKPLLAVFRGIAYFDERTLRLVGGGVADSSARVRDSIYNTWLEGLTAFFNRGRMYLRRLFVLMIKVDYDPRGDRTYQLFNLMNFDVDFIIFMGTLLLLLGASIFLLR